MGEDCARRIVLALLDRESYALVRATARDAAAGRAVQEDLGFSAAEVERADRDRARIARAYHARKREASPSAAAVGAQLEWLGWPAEGVAKRRETPHGLG